MDLAIDDRGDQKPGTSMLIGLSFVVLACLAGLAVNRPFRAPLSVAPLTGLAGMAVLTSWLAREGAPPQAGACAIVVLAAIGLGCLWRDRDALATSLRTHRLTAIVLTCAVALPLILLGSALAGVDAPVSTHDGAFHVETVDNLRRGIAVQGWYPMGFHASVAAILQIFPWLDTARGTAEAAEGLAMLAPFGIFALARGLGIQPRLAALGALVQALTYIYPYDDHMWAGWPLAASLLLLLGLWSIAAHWIDQPRIGFALLAGLIAGAILLTHGTEVYSSVIGLAVIAAMRWRRISFRHLVLHAPLAALAAALFALPYLSTLVGWAAGGGASDVGEASLQDLSAQGHAAANGGDWLEFVLGVTGAGSLFDLPVRAVLLGIGARQKNLRTVLGGWVVFGALLFAVSFLDLAPVHKLYAVTFPWLVHHRPPQLVVLFTSLLVGAGLFVAVRWFWSLRSTLASHPATWRRLAVVAGALLLFVAEGSAVTIFKTLQQVIADQNVYSADDRAAMSWLRQNAQPGETVINDLAGDAGIWAPYKAGVAVLVPRSGAPTLPEQRSAILANVLTLEDRPTLAATACGMHADWLYEGSRQVDEDPSALPDRRALESAADLQEVFRSGDAAVYRVTLPCDTMAAAPRD